MKSNCEIRNIKSLLAVGEKLIGKTWQNHIIGRVTNLANNLYCNAFEAFSKESERTWK